MAIRSVEESMTGQVKQGESVYSVSFIKRISRDAISGNWLGGGSPFCPFDFLSSAL